MAWTALLSASLILAGRQGCPLQARIARAGLCDRSSVAACGHASRSGVVHPAHGWLAGSDSMTSRGRRRPCCLIQHPVESGVLLLCSI
jgi:hypothetical protein